MIGLDCLIGQQHPVRLLVQALQNEKMPHAWLFTGEDGVGKKTAALELARVTNCRHRPSVPEPTPAPGEVFFPNACGQCRSCKKIRAGVHPEIQVLAPSGVYIRIDQVRALCADLTLKSDANACRFVIIDQAHRMNAEASNALLKILEEPPEQTVFVLVAPDTSNLLPTVVSRCQHIRFHPIAQAELEAYLSRHCNTDARQAMIIASLARGSLGRAMAMAAEDWSALRSFIIEQLRQLPAHPRVFQLVLAEMLAKDKDRLDAILEIIKNWYRDLAVVAHCPDQIYNRDLSDLVQTASLEISTDRILAASEAIASAEKSLLGNANARLVMEKLLADLAEPVLTCAAH